MEGRRYVRALCVGLMVLTASVEKEAALLAFVGSFTEVMVVMARDGWYLAAACTAVLGWVRLWWWCLLCVAVCLDELGEGDGDVRSALFMACCWLLVLPIPLWWKLLVHTVVNHAVGPLTSGCCWKAPKGPCAAGVGRLGEVMARESAVLYVPHSVNGILLCMFRLCGLAGDALGMEHMDRRDVLAVAALLQCAVMLLVGTSVLPTASYGLLEVSCASAVLVHSHRLLDPTPPPLFLTAPYLVFTLLIAPRAPYFSHYIPWSYLLATASFRLVHLLATRPIEWLIAPDTDSPGLTSEGESEVGEESPLYLT